jgi:hypothetical protein
MEGIALIRSRVPFLVTLVHALRKMGLRRSGRDDFDETCDSLEELVRYLCAADLTTLEEDDGATTARKKSLMVLRSEAELQELNSLEKRVRAADEGLREAVNKAKLFREEAFAELAEMQLLLNNELVSAQNRMHQDQDQQNEACRPPSPWNFSLDVLLEAHHSELVHPRYTTQPENSRDLENPPPPPQQEEVASPPPPLQEVAPPPPQEEEVAPPPPPAAGETDKSGTRRGSSRLKRAGRVE